MTAGNDQTPGHDTEGPNGQQKQASDVSLTAGSLDAVEAEQLAKAESIIEANYAAFLKVGLALAKIRDEKLYRATHKTFAAYVDERWNFTRTHAYRLIEAGEVAEAMSPIGDIPESESHARALKLVVDEHGPAAAGEVMGAVKVDGAVTAKSITKKADELGYGKPSGTKPVSASNLDDETDLGETSKPTEVEPPTVTASRQFVVDVTDCIWGLQPLSESHLRRLEVMELKDADLSERELDGAIFVLQKIRHHYFTGGDR